MYNCQCIISYSILLCEAIVIYWFPEEILVDFQEGSWRTKAGNVCYIIFILSSANRNPHNFWGLSRDKGAILGPLREVENFIGSHKIYSLIGTTVSASYFCESNISMKQNICEHNNPFFREILVDFQQGSWWTRSGTVCHIIFILTEPGKQKALKFRVLSQAEYVQGLIFVRVCDYLFAIDCHYCLSIWLWHPDYNCNPFLSSLGCIWSFHPQVQWYETCNFLDDIGSFYCS